MAFRTGQCIVHAGKFLKFCTAVDTAIFIKWHNATPSGMRTCGGIPKFRKAAALHHVRLFFHDASTETILEVPQFYNRRQELKKTPEHAGIAFSPLDESSGFDYKTVMQTITRMLLLSKSGNIQARETAQRIQQRLTGRGCLVANASTADLKALDSFCASPCDNAAVIVLGGDGTLVGVARRLLEHRVTCPILSINFGKVGFLAEVPSDSWVEPVDALLENRLSIVSRLVLGWEILRGENRAVAFSGFAVNDVVLSRGTLARVLSLHLSIDGHPLSTVRADGVLVSTPAGTSGYALSTGASLVHPGVEAVTVAAISPFLSRFPSLVLPPESVVDITVDKTGYETYLTVDGQDGIALMPGDIVRTRGQAGALRLAIPDSTAYYRRLGLCGFVPPMKG